MVDGYAWFSVVVRTIALFYFIGVFRRQYKVYKIETRVRDYQIDLIILVALLFLANCFTIYFNFHRGSDGNLVEIVRHISQVLNALSAIGTAMMLYYRVYKKDS